MSAPNSPESESELHFVGQRFTWLPKIDSWGYHLLLILVAILILGPLGGVTATYMNFSLGFFVGGQVLAGILGSAVTYGYGSEGKHGANYIQTLAASVASMAGMAVLIQAMHWLGLDPPETWKLVLFYLCIGMFGVGVGMLYTPLLVDKMRLTYPSGFAVANILRALTDQVLLKLSIGRLFLGAVIGALGGVLGYFVPFVGKTQFSGATFGAGMVVGIRIALPALFIGLIGDYILLPAWIDAGWLHEGDPFRKLGFVVALGAILGASIIDITMVGKDFVHHLRHKEEEGPAKAQEGWQKVNNNRLFAWVAFWGVMIFLVATQLFEQDPLYVLIAIGLVFVFMLVNGISLGISDSNPISSAFVLTVLVLATIGLSDAIGGLICASIILVAVSIGGDMQQDRSTGWRLGTSRTVQFRYQVIGVTMGAILAVAMASFFMGEYDVLNHDQTDSDAVAEAIRNEAVALTAEDLKMGETELKVAILEGTLSPEDAKILKSHTSEVEAAHGRWQSAMTYKFVGALDVFIGRKQAQEGEATALTADEEALLKLETNLPSFESLEEQKVYASALVQADREKTKNIQMMLLLIGIGFGMLIETIRKMLRGSKRYQAWKNGSKAAYRTDFVLDVTVFASPYASSFGGFVDLLTSGWFAAGGTLSAISDSIKARQEKKGKKKSLMPEDMSTNSLVGGGLIAGESLFFLALGLVSLIGSFFA